MDTRVGYPTEHLATGTDDITSPMYSTGVGLILKGFERIKNNTDSIKEKEVEVTAEENGDGRKKQGSGLSNFLDFLKSTTDNIIGQGIE